MRHLQSLTPLRGIAALTVVMFHLARTSGDPSVPAFFLHGYLGVDLFFVLSGFIPTHVYVQGFLSDTSWRSVGAFLWARVARIYPVYLFVMALLVAGGGALIYRCVEVPCRTLLRRAPDRLRRLAARA